MDSQWLKRQFDCNPEKSKAGLARVLSLEPPAVSKILNGTRQIKAQEYNLMRQYFGLPIDGENAAVLSDNSYRLDMLAGENTLQENPNESPENSWVIPAEILASRTKAPPNKIKIFSIKESFMEPEFRHGEHVLIDLSDNNPSPPGTFIISDGFGVMLRNCEYVPNSTPTEVRISANSQSFQSQILQEGDFEIIGRVIAKLQWL